MQRHQLSASESPASRCDIDIEKLLGDLEALAAGSAGRRVFYDELLANLGYALDAEDASFWELRAGRLAPVRRAPTATDQPWEPWLIERLEECRAADRPMLIPYGRTAVSGAVLACPVHNASGPFAVLACRVPPVVEESTGQDYLAVGAAIAEIADQFELRSDVKRMKVAARRRQQLEAFLLRVHRAETGQDIVRELAEEGRRLLACDRVSVLVRSGARWRVAAVSGVEQHSPRSQAVSQMERLAHAALRAPQPELLWSTDTELAPQIQTRVDAYLEESGAREFVLAPCPVPPQDPHTHRPRLSLAILAEQFEGELPADAYPLLHNAREHAAVAFERAVRTGMLGSLRRAAGAAHASAKRAVLLLGALAALAAGGAALMLIPADLKIATEGRFAPAERARVFAPFDANIEEVLVQHGQQVRAGDPLLRLDSLSLRLDLEEAESALATARQEISALETAKLRAGLPGADRQLDVSAIAAKITALEKQVQHQHKRIELLNSEIERFVLYSPIAGKVLSWRPQDYLGDRPVRRGQRLLEIAETEGAWNIELDVPDRQTGHLIEAAQTSAPLMIEYVVKSDPATVHRGRVQRIAAATQADSSGEPTLRLEVAPHDAGAAAPRSGMTVSAKVYCGKHSLGYVWFHETLEVLQRRFF